MVSYGVDLSAGITACFFTNIQRLAGSNQLLTKRLTDISIELLQNIKHHGLNSNHDFLIIERHSSHFSIECCNQIHSQQEDVLRNNIQHINSLNTDQLKKEHSTLLRKPTSGGLGFHRIAIRSKSELKASFTSLNQDYILFTLHINLAA